MKSAKIAIIMILSIIMSQYTEAQSISTNNSTTFVAAPDRKDTDMKAVEPYHATMINPDVKIVNKLAHLFPLAFNQKWWIIKEDYHVSFMNENQNGWAVFTRKGKMRYAVVNCSLEQLPLLLQREIADVYSNYSIVQSLEINAYNLLAHQVILENEKRYVTLKATTDGLEEIATMTKRK